MTQMNRSARRKHGQIMNSKKVQDTSFQLAQQITQVLLGEADRLKITSSEEIKFDDKFISNLESIGNDLGNSILGMVDKLNKDKKNGPIINIKSK